MILRAEILWKQILSRQESRRNSEETEVLKRIDLLRKTKILGGQRY